MADQELIPYTKHTVSWQDEEAVKRVFQSGRLTQGPEVEAFESEFAAKVGAKYCVAVSSGTAALHLAYLACGVGPKASIITTPISFVATANAALYCGAKIDFVDTEPDGLMRRSWPTMSRDHHPSTGWVVPVHLGGRVCPPHWHTEHQVIEDASHLGTGPTHWREYPDSWTAATFSFHASKIIAAGEAGAVVTNEPSIWRACKHNRDHGRAFAGDMFSLGFNYRMDEMSAALARSQLRWLDESIRRRRQIAKVYDEAFLDHPQIEVVQGPDSVYHLYQILVSDRDRIRRDLESRGIATQIHYRPIHLEPYYRERFGYQPGDFPNAERFAARTLSLPMFPTLTEGEVNHVIESVLACLG